MVELAESLKQLANNKEITVMMTVIIFDVLFGVMVAVKQKSINSNTGINGIMRKASCIMLLIMFNLLNKLEPTMFTDVAYNGLFVALMGFELISVVENLNNLGINIPVLNKYLLINNEETNTDVKKDTDTIKKDTDLPK